MTNTAYNAKFTPTAIASRRLRSGTLQLKARGVIESRRGNLVRTIVAYGRLHDEILPRLEEGRQVLLRGFYDRVQNEDGSAGGEYFKPFKVLRVYDAETPPPANDPRKAAGHTGRSPIGHERKGHWRWLRNGKGRVWVRQCDVKGGKQN